MNNDLSEIYQAIILDHNKNPRNARSMSSPTHIATGYNPLCGDEIKVYILINKNHIFDISFISEGCAISKASASLMTLAVKNENLISVNNKIKEFNNLFNTKKENSINYEALGELIALKGVNKFPARIKCATLAWHTLGSALKVKNN